MYLYNLAKLNLSLFDEWNSCQLNAYPSKPAGNIDLYTSHVHGEPGVTVTMAIKTCKTKHSTEIPILHIELCMAPPQVV
jgi:hypothetical protein